MRKYIYVLILGLAFGFNANAQDIFRGTVKDSASKSTLSSVRIENAELKSGISSDENGLFSIAVRLGDHIIFSRVGHRNKVIIVKEQNLMQDNIIEMSSKPYQLKTVTIKQELTQYQKDSASRADIYQDAFDYHQTSSIMSPVTSVYQKFSKKYKDLRKFQSQIVNIEQQKFIDTRYTPELVAALIKIPKDSVMPFINSFPMEYDFARAASDLEIKMWIKYNYLDYEKMKKVKPTSKN